MDKLVEHKIGKVKERLEGLTKGPTGYAGIVAKEALEFIAKLEEALKEIRKESCVMGYDWGNSKICSIAEEALKDG